MKLKSIIDDLLYLVYPNLCVGCHEEAVHDEELFCINCETKLPLTDFHEIQPNEATDRMAGGFGFLRGLSMFRFYPGGMVQHMIHEIKYRGQTNIARRLGRRYGVLLKELPDFIDLHCIVPVPLHPRKLRSRGYNQSRFFAEGLADSLICFSSSNYLLRTKETSTQTSKTRYERLESMMKAFSVSDKASVLKGKHILLVDDVLTTGATLMSCAQALSLIPDIKISFATIGLAQ
ncbi:MAG: ComF family protein [Saprospiraceae bacterium]|nr:ComF family protein [Saprospiraceae bacterium]